MKKTIILIALLLICCFSVKAQYLLKVDFKDGTHELYEVDCTENIEWSESNYLGNHQIYMSVYGRLAGKHNTSGYGYPTDMIEKVSVVSSESSVPVNEQSAFTIDEQTAAVSMANYSIEFGPSVIEGQKTLTVSRVENPTLPQEVADGVSYMMTYDFNLEDIHDLNGVVVIRFPATKNCYTAYFDETSGQWEPVLSYYDSETNEMVIISDHLSKFTVFDVNNEHKRTAYLVYKGFDPTTPADIQAVVDRFAAVANSDNPERAAIVAFYNEDFAMYSLGLNIFMTPISVGGFEPILLTSYSNTIGHIGTAWSILQFANTLRSNDDASKATSAVKLAFDLALKPYLEKKIYAGNFLFPACMTALAALDWEINWFAGKVHGTATSLYEDAYNKYFLRGSSYPSSGYGYRSATEWYKLINPLFEDRGNMPDDVKAKIEEMVTDYVNQPWRDTDGYNMAVAECRNGWPFWVEISDNDRRVIAENHRKELYSGTLKSVIDHINLKALAKTKEMFDDAYKEYANMMNKVVILKFTDSTVKSGEKSKFAGCKIRFPYMPSTIEDPMKWETTVKENGEADIQFRVYPYLSEGFHPELEVVDESDNLVGKIHIEGIHDSGKIMEATFDLSNGEVLNLRDSWDMTINPNRAQLDVATLDGVPHYFAPLIGPNDKYWGDGATVVAHTVPGDAYGIFNGIADVFTERTLNIDADGKFSVKNDKLTMSGSYNSRTGIGTGKFSLTATSEGSNFVTEDQAFDFWYGLQQWVASGNDANTYKDKSMAWTALEHFNADFSVSGTMEIRYSDMMESYSIHFDGIGTYNLLGTQYAGGADTYWDEDTDGHLVLKYHSKKMDTWEMFVKDGQFVFCPTLIFR